MDTKGTKDTEAVVQTISLTCHSYIIMPNISVAGNLMNLLYIVLPESSGKLDPRVFESLFIADNLYISSSSSGKMGKQHLLEWFKMVYFVIINMTFSFQIILIALKAKI